MSERQENMRLIFIVSTLLKNTGEHLVFHWVFFRFPERINAVFVGGFPFFATQILGGHVTSRNQGLLPTTKGGREERPWERGWCKVTSSDCIWRVVPYMVIKILPIAIFSSPWQRRLYLKSMKSYIYYINTSEIPSELSRENFISSHVKITCYLHVWRDHRRYGYIDKSRLWKQADLVFHWCLYNKQNITCPLMDMNFIFSCSTRYLTRSLRSLVRYRVDHSKIKFISTRGHVISSIYYMALSHKDWELPNSRIWLAEMDIDRGLDFPI